MLCRLLPRQGPEMHKFRNTNLSVAVVTGGAAGERSLPDAPPESVPGWVPRRGRNTSLSRPQSSATDRSRAALHPGAASSMQSSQSVAAASSMQPLRVDLPALACSEAASIDATDPLSAGASADCAGESRGLRVDLPPVRGSGNSGTTVQQPTHIASAAADPSYADPSSASVASVAAGPVARGRISVGQLDNQSSHVPQVGRSESGPGSNRSGGRSSCGPWSVGDEREYDIVRTLFDEVVHWKRNIFMLPLGSAGREFVMEIANIISFFNLDTPLSGIAWTVLTIACHLLLQKPLGSSRGGENATILRSRLELWKAGKLEDLLLDARCIQAHLRPRRVTSARSERGHTDTDFSRHVFSGNINSAIRCLSESKSPGVLRLDDIADPATGETVDDILRQKHPAGADPDPDVLLEGEPEPVRTVLFAAITADLIKKIARSIKGSSGPSGVDADGWRAMLTCYAAASDQLCSVLAEAARRICTDSVGGRDLEAFTAARLIALDKRPGVRPIAVGEVHRRIIARAVMRVVESDVMDVVAPSQLCVGIPSACETCVHAMREGFNNPSTEGILLVDASNAFNSVNRKAALHNIRRLCPALATFASNTHTDRVRLFVTGSGELHSTEGTCQGDPLAMAIYALAITPLVRRLAHLHPDTFQLWYADDDAALGRLLRLRGYWDTIAALGPRYGYNPNAQKTVLVVKNHLLEQANTVFDGTGVIITGEGSKYLGAPIGTPEYCSQHLAAEVGRFSRQVRRCGDFAETQPHAAYTAAVRGLVPKWRYLMRASLCSGETMAPLDSAVDNHLLPPLLGQPIASGSALRRLMSAPSKCGGIAIPMLADTATIMYNDTVKTTRPVRGLYRFPDVPETGRVGSAADGGADGGGSSGLREMAEALQEAEGARRAAVQSRRRAGKASLAGLQDHLSATQQLLMDVAGSAGVSSWLTAEPRLAHGTVLNASDFRDALALRYGLQLPGLPSTCVCGDASTMDHLLTCPAGGYPSARHDNVRDILAETLSEAVRDVETEPRLRPLSGEDLPYATANRTDEARLDIRARGFWTRQQDAYFDVRVTHPKASVLSRSEVLGQLRSHERRKKAEYGPRIVNIERASFTPLVFTTQGLAAPECAKFLSTLATYLSRRHIDIPYSILINRLRVRISFCLLRWAVTCFRGCRASYQRRRQSSFLVECRQMGGR
eukprot:scpid15790/ scgid28089/ 